MRRLLAATATLAALTAAGLATTPTHAATYQRHDPCFATDGEFNDWWNGDRWGASLSKVEDGYFNCVGYWQDNDGNGPDDVGDWNGHNEHIRIWPQKDGGQVDIYFAHYDTAPTWRAHDMAYNTGYGWMCEWPRPDGNPC